MTKRPGTNELRSTTKLATGALPAASGWYLLLETSDRGAPLSRVVSLADGDEIVLGRGAESDVVLAYDGVSRRHAKVSRRGSTITVEDLGSTNGTRVNQLVIQGSRRVTAGDAITLGTVTAVLAATSAARERRTIATITELEDRMGAEIERARRYGRSLGLVAMRVAGLADDVDAHVRELSRSLRRMDLLADYGGDELVILLPESDRVAIDAVIARARAAPAGITVACGGVAYPAETTSGGELIGRARAAMLSGDDRPARTGGTSMIVVDPRMEHVMAMVDRVAAAPITVLLYGESGVGKDVIAEAIHARSPRSARPFVRLDCGALPEALFESELFGHVHGAFTGAIADKAGQLEAAHTGTLFLDGLDELSLGMQSKLLRVLEQRRFLRVGATSETQIDVRVVCATHHDLETEVKRGRFREDLYFRVSAFAIPIPPLRDRRSEIVPLARRFADELARGRTITFEPSALALLEAYDWPGNVRELRNAIERALVLGESRIAAEHLPERVVAAAPDGARPRDIRQRVASMEKQAILDALMDASGKQAAAAKALGISRFALARLLDKHGIKKR